MQQHAPPVHANPVFAYAGNADPDGTHYPYGEMIETSASALGNAEYAGVDKALSSTAATYTAPDPEQPAKYDSAKAISAANAAYAEIDEADLDV